MALATLERYHNNNLFNIKLLVLSIKQLLKSCGVTDQDVYINTWLIYSL